MLSPVPSLPDQARTESPPDLLSVKGLVKHYALPGRWFGRAGVIPAVDDVSFSIGSRETLGLVGESGSGKSTIGRMIMRLIRPTAGNILFDGQDWLASSGEEFRRARRRVQMVFQSPYASLDPRWRIADIVAEPLRTHQSLPAAELRDRVAGLLQAVGLDPSVADRHPHQFSGGQRQRIGIARAIALEPDLLVADEPVSALDVSVQAQILALLQDIKARGRLSMLFISHDLSVVAYLCDRVGVLYRGRLVELAGTRSLFHAPGHPYTRALLAAIPGSGQRCEASAPSSAAVSETGCAYASRCPHAREPCRTIVPALRPSGSGALIACHRVGEI
ncbi:oligopeptide/dipeptide ABC transporter ATP-binding protein [Mesorhizobium sp. 1M-11]|uniref:ABC transporter ATP-binding protein n=1 Tax=Mesorhizobium sp. 1M-11 TaxID=1529006 RepID=UPI0006C74567|nr:oligopeptide/dipeptide ABC transporter ATP-binding protein [Mesorhizobium sp. 1M-11]